MIKFGFILIVFLVLYILNNIKIASTPIYYYKNVSSSNNTNPLQNCSVCNCNISEPLPSFVDVLVFENNYTIVFQTIVLDSEIVIPSSYFDANDILGFKIENSFENPVFIFENQIGSGSRSNILEEEMVEFTVNVVPPKPLVFQFTQIEENKYIIILND